MLSKIKLLTPEQAAEKLSISVRTLAKWRSIGSPNIPYNKIGRCVRYNPEDLELFLIRNSFNKPEVRS